MAISKSQIKWVDILEKRVVKTFSDRQIDDKKTFEIVVHPDHFLLAASTVETPSETIIAWSFQGKPMKRIFSSNFGKIKHIRLVGSYLYALSNDNSILSIQLS